MLSLVSLEEGDKGRFGGKWPEADESHSSQNVEEQGAESLISAQCKRFQRTNLCCFKPPSLW